MFHRTIAGRNLDKVCFELFGVGVKLSPSPNDSSEGILSLKCESLPCDCIMIPSTFNGTSERKICPLMHCDLDANHFMCRTAGAIILLISHGYVVNQTLGKQDPWLE
jgi:hypothetical protein